MIKKLFVLMLLSCAAALSAARLELPDGWVVNYSSFAKVQEIDGGVSITYLKPGRNIEITKNVTMPKFTRFNFTANIESMSAAPFALQS